MDRGRVWYRKRRVAARFYAGAFAKRARARTSAMIT